MIRELAPDWFIHMPCLLALARAPLAFSFVVVAS